jgi:choline dehydrogenase-like flavoprotein
MTSAVTHPFDQAIVVGASMAGLWTARVLADHFRQVTVLERDRLPDGAAPRPGVPQGRHVHVLLQRGTIIMGTLAIHFCAVATCPCGAGFPACTRHGQARKPVPLPGN